MLQLSCTGPAPPKHFPRLPTLLIGPHPSWNVLDTENTSSLRLEGTPAQPYDLHQWRERRAQVVEGDEHQPQAKANTVALEWGLEEQGRG